MADRPRIVIEFYGEQDVRFDAKVEGHLSPLQLYAAFSVLSSYFKELAKERIFGKAKQQSDLTLPDNIDFNELSKFMKK